MGYEYTQESRRADAHSLPDVELIHISLATPKDECPTCCHDDEMWDRNSDPDEAEHGEACVGWYYANLDGGLDGWTGAPSGPYATESDALKAAREDAGVCEHGASDDEPCAACDGAE